MINPVDLIFHTVTIMAVVMLAGLLLATRNGRPAAVPGAFLCFAAAAFFLTSDTALTSTLGAWRYPLTALCVTKAAWFWLLTRGLFLEGARIQGAQLAVIGSAAVVGMWQQLVFLPLHRSGEASIIQSIAGFAVEGALLSFVLLGLRNAWRDLDVDLVEHRRRLRLGLLLLTGGYLSVAILIQTHNMFLNVSTPPVVVRANMLFVATTCLIAAWLLLKPRINSWLDSEHGAPAGTLRPAEAAVLTKLELALAAERIHMQEGLSIGSLAAHLGTGEHLLRRVINTGMGYRNFNDFLHAYRIAEACEELIRPDQARHSVLSIAMKVGYGSIGAFNRAFKSRMGMTPTAYRRDHMSGTTTAP